MRDVTAEELEAYASGNARPALFYEGVFDSVTLRLWTGSRDKTFLGQTFLGNGWLYAIRTAAEIDEIRASGISIEFNACNPTVLSLVLNESKHKATGKLWLCMLDEDWQIIGDGYQLFSGRLEKPEGEISRNGSRVSIGYESVLASLLRRRERRLTDQDQRLLWSTDAGLQYVVQASQWSGYWGRGENKLRLRRRDRR